MQKKKVALGSAAAAVAGALLVTNPMVAEAARMITSADIVNGTIQSRDIDNKTIKAKDLAPKSVKSWNIAQDTVRSSDVKDGSLKAADFAPGSLPVSAYARVTAGADGATLDAERSKNVASVTRTAAGTYCLELAAGVDRGVAVLASHEGGTANAGTDSAAWSGACGTNGVQVMTERLSDSPSGIGSTPVNDISFMVLVP
jgi:hypothetical protein